MATRSEATAVRTTWRIDPAHSLAEFSAKHLMITRVKGRFGKIDGTVVVDESNPKNSMVDVRIDASSIDTGVEDRDAHLRSADFLDVENHPEITFRSRRVEGALEEEGDEFQVEGDLTIRGVTRPATLACVYHGSGPDPWGGERASFSARTEFDRRMFGLEWNQALEKGGVLVGYEIRVDLEVQVVKQS